MSDDVKQLVQSIFDKGHVMSLATVDDHGPWVSDVLYVADDAWNIYWLSKTDTRHSQAIITNSLVAATITLTSKSKEPNEGLQIAGIAEKISGDVFAMAVKHMQKRNHPAPEKEGDILHEGMSWYSLKPTKIDLIYEPLFGFRKQTIF